MKKRVFLSAAVLAAFFLVFGFSALSAQSAPDAVQAYHDQMQLYKNHLKELREQEIDTLVLGCTHYPLIAEVIGKILGSGVTLIDAGAESARATRALLTERGELAQRECGTSRYYTSDRVDGFERLASLFLGEDITGQVQQIDISQY